LGISLDNNKKDRVKRELRKGKLANTNGPGSIWTTSQSESFVITTIEQWRDSTAEDEIRLDRLANALKVDSIRNPPTRLNPGREEKSDEIVGVSALRFPGWLVCSGCGHMKKWTGTDEDNLDKTEYPSCATCGDKGRLTPVRYVQCCGAGHLADLDWPDLVHFGQQGCRSEENLYWRNPDSGSGSGLSSEVLECRSCKEELIVEKIYGSKINRFNQQCTHQHPWSEIVEIRPGCEKLIVEQRGSQSLHSSILAFALDIPPKAFEIAREFFQTPDFKNLIDEIRRSGLTSNSFFEKKPGKKHRWENKCRVKKIGFNRLLEEAGSRLSKMPEVADLKIGEWRAFLEAEQPPEDCTQPNFLVEKADLPDQLSDWFDMLRIGNRLRMVQVFRGFSRMESGNPFGETDEFDAEWPASLANPNEWLPGIESFGEGFFLNFRKDRLWDWWERCSESIEPRIPERFRELHRSRDLAVLRLVHTLSHLLINTLAGNCGYPAASLGEKLFVNLDETAGDSVMAGLLIHTQSDDLEGSFGGLVREGRPERLGQTIGRALESARWCSSDPVCSSALGGACHACCHVNEISCEFKAKANSDEVERRANWHLDRYILKSLFERSMEV